MSMFYLFLEEIKTQFNQKSCFSIYGPTVPKNMFLIPFPLYLSKKKALSTKPLGVAKCKNQHLLDVARVLLFHMHVPKRFCSDALLTPCHLINRMSSTLLDGASSYSILFPSSLVLPLPPSVFECVCFVHNLPWARF
jgi:hypothetical protein